MDSVTPQPMSPPLPAEPEHKPNWKRWLLIIVAVAVLSSLATLIASASILSKQPQPTPTPTVSQPTPTPDPIANWKTYTNDKFTFKYPSTLTVEERAKDFFVIIPVDITPSPQQGVSIDARLTGNFTNFDTAVNTTKQNLEDPQTNTLSNGVILSGRVGPGFGENLPVTIALLRYKEGAISVERLTTDSTVDVPTFDQILSTFKSTDLTKSAKDGCVIGGCNSELCLDKETAGDGVASICLYKPEFACYKDATCEKQANGTCGWTQTSQLQACLKSPPSQ